MYVPEALEVHYKVVNFKRDVLLGLEWNRRCDFFRIAERKYNRPHDRIFHRQVRQHRITGKVDILRELCKGREEGVFSAISAGVYVFIAQ